MSVKLMTAQAIRDDLNALYLTWPEGVPPEQTDRVNALTRELKYRGEAPWSPMEAKASAAPASAQEQTTADLEKELRKLSDRIALAPNDAVAQNRFADVRFELRRRAKADIDNDGVQATTGLSRSSPLPPRALELPPDADFAAVLKEAAGKVRDDRLLKEIVSRAETPPQAKTATVTVRPRDSDPVTAPEFIIFVADNGGIVIERTWGTQTDVLHSHLTLTRREARDLVRQLVTALDGEEK